MPNGPCGGASARTCENWQLRLCLRRAGVDLAPPGVWRGFIEVPDPSPAACPPKGSLNFYRIKAEDGNRLAIAKMQKSNTATKRRARRIPHRLGDGRGCGWAWRMGLGFRFSGSSGTCTV